MEVFPHRSIGRREPRNRCRRCFEVLFHDQRRSIVVDERLLYIGNGELKAVLRQVEVDGHGRGVEADEEVGAAVVTEAGSRELLGSGSSPDGIAGFDDAHAQAGSGQVGTAGQAVVTGAYDQNVEICHPWGLLPVLSHTTANTFGDAPAGRSVGSPGLTRDRGPSL